jgi:hypothetical protein
VKLKRGSKHQRGVAATSVISDEAASIDVSKSFDPAAPVIKRRPTMRTPVRHRRGVRGLSDTGMMAARVTFMPKERGPSGAQKRKARGRRSSKVKCACGLEMTARRGLLSCPACGNH